MKLLYGYQRGLASMVYKFFEKKTGSEASINEELAQELHKPIINKFKRRKAYERFNNIWAADSVETGSSSLKNRGVKYFFCVIDVFTKYAWVKPLKDKTVLHGFIEIVNESSRKPNKLWVNQGREFYNNHMRKWLDDNDILLNLTRNEVKSIVAERFIRTSKSKIYKKMTANDSKFM